MAKLEQMKPFSIDDALTVLVDGLCIRCDSAHTHPHACKVSMAEWRQSYRYSMTAQGQNALILIHNIRRDRAEKVMGRG